MAGTVFALMATACASLAEAQSMSVPYPFEIDRVSLTEALSSFSKQTGFSVSFISKTRGSEDRLVGPLQGRYTAEDALEQLLRRNGLNYTVVKPGVIAVIDSDPPPRRRTEPVMSLTKLDQESAPQSQSRSASARAVTAENNTAAQRDFEEEVIVTAQKRAERLQDVPISISVVGGDQLDGATGSGVRDALNNVPGVAITATSLGGGLISVRGVTAGDAMFNGSSPVAYYVDSVPFGLIKSAAAPDTNAYDLERIEVLRGPQGTLYGASAQNGVVRIITKDPDTEEFEFKARSSLSSTSEGGENFRGDMALNVPIVDGKLGLRVVAGYEDMSGWIDRLNKEDINDAEVTNVRAKLGAQLTEQLSVDVSAWLSRTDYGALSLGNDDDVIRSTIDEPVSSDFDVLGLKIEYDFAGATLASTTSYIDYGNNAVLDVAPLFGVSFPFNTFVDSSVFSQEVILNSTEGESWRWSIGAMYRDAEDRLVQAAVFLNPTIDFSDTSESTAVFGELTRLLAEGRVEVTAGLRYFEDDVEQIENIAQSGNPADPLIRRSDTFDKVSPRVVLTWHPGENSTLYTSYAEGFRSGFNQNANVLRTAPSFQPLKADNLKNYEVGAKALAGGVTLNAAAFYIDWEDVQQSTRVIANGVPVTALVNGTSASGPGVEFGVSASPVSDLALSLSFSWNDLEMDADVFSESSVLFDKGDRLNLSPELTAGGSAEYAFALGSSSLEGRLSASANYTSKQESHRVEGGSQIVEEGDDVLIGRTAFSVDSSNGWTATLFVDNVTDERAFPTRTSPVDWSTRVRPRTVGLQLEARF